MEEDVITTARGTVMTSVLEDKDKNRVTITTKQYGNGVSVDTSVKVKGLPSAAFGDGKDYHIKLRQEIKDMGGKFISGTRLGDNKSKFRTLE